MEGVKKKRILLAAIGSCVHTAGVLNFVTLAEKAGYGTRFLGPAVALDDLVAAIREYRPDIVGVSYRLTSASARSLFQRLQMFIAGNSDLQAARWILGCTNPVRSVAERTGIFEAIFSGSSASDDVRVFLQGRHTSLGTKTYPQGLIQRIVWKEPFPLIRHHFGLPDFDETLKGVATIAESKVLDVISVGPDQNAQGAFFHPDEMVDYLEGDGGVPLRDRSQLEALYTASRRGNYPLLRCYSGTRDLLRWAEMLSDTIHNAWCATPLVWYSVLDGRSKRPLLEAISENQSNFAWHAKNDIPVEVNESHHWSLRGAHDTIAVAMAYLAAYNAKAFGVRHYISQYMLNTPLGTSPKMDIAKMLAEIEMIESLQDENFRTIREIRPGLLSYPEDMDMGKGQLAASIYTGMMLNPNIVHVVGFCEADHAATSADIIESCKIARRVVADSLLGLPDPRSDNTIITRKNELMSEASILIHTIASLGSGRSGNPLTDPQSYVDAVRLGILDAPGLKGNSIARAKSETGMIDGKCMAIDSDSGEPVCEKKRLEQLSIAVEL